MNLAVDIGNTRTKIGLFRENQLAEQAIWTDCTLAEMEAFCSQASVENVILSSVAESGNPLHIWLAGRFNVMELTHNTLLPFENQYGTPQTLGKDRLAAVAGAHHLYPETNCLVVDCGTCIKYDVLSAEGIYPGGNIAPGARMRIQAMHHFTARLPEVAMEMPANFTGYSTETALQNGALRGAVLEIQGFIRLFEQAYGRIKTVLTGGDAPFFLSYFNRENIVHQPDLTLFGLNHILNFNTNKRLYAA
jgi:type III pantothenate kinase